MGLFQNFPAEWKWGRHACTPQWVAKLKTGWSLYKSRAHKANGYNAAGTHGYDDDSESHEGLFIASGPAFKQGLTFPKFSNIHVYQLLAHLMQIEPAPNDGDFNAVSGMLKDEYAISLPESLWVRKVGESGSLKVCESVAWKHSPVIYMK